MAIQYYMRAYNTTLSKYVDWAVNDAPDSTGAFSGFPVNQLINITVNRIVQSKIANFLKPNESLGGNDGYYFHVNSYDWKNADSNNPSFSPLTRLSGIAVENGLVALSPSSGINGATNASPIVITLSSPPTVPLVTGQILTIVGVTGNTNANGTWPITVVDTTHFSLTGSTGNGTYSAGSGNAFLPKDMPTLTWDPTNSVWRFVLNTNGDGVTLGLSQSVKVNNFIIDGYEAFGFPTASQGVIRLPNNQFIFGRNSLNNGDVQAIGIDNFPTSTGSNRIKLGAISSDFVFTPGNLGVDGYIQHNGQGGGIAATTGFINDKNNTIIVAFRNAAGLLDITALSSNASNNIILGDATNTGILYNTSTANIHQFQVNTVPSFEIGTTFVRFPSAVTLPTILQTATAAANATGQTLVVQAQNSTNGTTTGGILSLTSGTGNTANGSVDINTGATLKIRVFPSVGVGANNNSIQYFENLFRVDTAQTNPLFRQDDVNISSTPGQTYTIQSQNAIGANSAGGILALTSGTGTTNSGQVQVQTGGTTQIIVSPLTIPPGGTTSTTGTVIIRGNLEVVGTTTTVDSTVVDIIGRVIHANWADPISSPNVAVPSQNVGYSVHRGNTAGVPRDGAAWIWSEGTQNSGSDGYWRAVTLIGDGFGTDNFTPANSPFTVGILGNSHIVTSDPNPINGTLPNVGGLRVPSNIPAVAARNTNVLTVIAAGSNLATLPQATINVTATAGFTTAGTLLIISSTGAQTVTYTGTTANSFTGATGGAGTLAVGSSVAQTNNSTTIAAGSNGANLPQSTINVATTVGFPTAGTIRILTNGASGGVQVVTYTGTGATTFTGCTGGTGTMTTGNSVSSPSIAGTTDILLLGTDFGNRITHGDGYSPKNSGHIFSTTTGSLFDFWVNSVTQLQLGANSDPADSFIATMGVGSTVNSPKLYQIVQPNTGANNGFNFKVAAQAGQQQAGGAANNNGGNIVLASGAPGTGGAGAAGVNGSVDLNTGATLKVRVFPTTAASAGDNNSILYLENLFRVDTAQTNPVFRQDSTGGATGQVYTIQAQNAATTGGALVLTSGTGTTAGNVQLQTGGVDRQVVHPTFNEFRDTAEALRITPVSAGTTQITYASTVTAAQINQTTTAAATGANMTIQSQNAATTGGALTLTTGTGATNPGNMVFQIGGTTLLTLFNTATVPNTLQWLGTTTSPIINQQATGGASGQALTIQAQNAATTGGDIINTSGTGTTAGNNRLQTGGVDRIIVHPTFTEFRDTAEALRITPVSAGTTQVTFATGVTTVSFNQTATAGATGAPWTIQAQTGASGTGGNISLIAGNATTTGGNAIVTSGTGTTAGNVQLQTGAVDRVVVHPTFTEFRDTAEALRITPVSSGTTLVTFASTVTAVSILQTTTAGATGATTTVQAQNAATTGGALNLTSGTGATTNGAVNLQVGGVTTASVVTNKFVHNKGQRRNITAVTGTYQVLATDDYLAITTIAAPFTITMPATPTNGDTYTIKDASGTAATNNVTISGNGVNIDGTATVVISQNYSAVVLTYTGTTWSIT